MDPPLKIEQKKSFSSEHGPVRRQRMASTYHRSHSENISPIDEEEDLAILRQSLENVNRIINENPSRLQRREEGQASSNVWEQRMVEEKRKLGGKKAKIVWTAGEVEICLRVVFSDKYLRFNELGYFVELDSANIDLPFQDQKHIQKSINRTLDQQGLSQENQHLAFMQRQSINWLKAVLLECHKIFQEKKYSLRQPARMAEFNRRKINSQYMLFPSPFCISWNPQGTLCVTKNRPLGFSRPIIGSIHSFKHFLDDPSKNRFNDNSAQEDFNMPTKKKQDQEKDNAAQNADLYAWELEEELNWSVFGERNQKQMKEKVYFQNYSHEVTTGKRQSLRYQGKKVPLVLVPNLSIYSAKLKNTFLKFVDPTHSAPVDMAPGDKLKIYFVNNKHRDLEQGLAYLAEKTKSIGSGRTDICEALMTNEFQGYKEILDAACHFQQLFPLKKKYDLVKFLAKEKLKLTSEKAIKFFLLKYLMVENEFFHFCLEDYFKEHFRKFKMVKELDFSLGSQSNFNEVKAEEYFMDILSSYFKFESAEKERMEKKKRKYLNNPQKYDDPNYERKIYLKRCQKVEELKLFLRGYSKEPNFGEQGSYRRSPSKSHDGSSPFAEAAIQQQKSLIGFRTQKNANYNGLGIVVVRKREVTPLNFELILNPEKRKELLSALIPLMWAKEFNTEQYEYKIIKKALIANSKILNFMAKMNGLIQKLENKRKVPFLKNLCREYTGYIQSCSQDQYGRSFIVTCQKCSVQFNVFTIRELKEKSICSRCRNAPFAPA